MDEFAGGEFFFVGWENHEGVRLGEGGQVAGAAPFDGGDLRVGALPFDARGQRSALSPDFSFMSS